MLRLLFLTTSYPAWPGDYAGIFVHRLARELADMGYPVTVLTPLNDGAQKRSLQEGVDVVRFPYHLSGQGLCGLPGGIEITL